MLRAADQAIALRMLSADSERLCSAVDPPGNGVLDRLLRHSPSLALMACETGPVPVEELAWRHYLVLLGALLDHDWLDQFELLRGLRVATRLVTLDLFQVLCDVVFLWSLPS